MSLGVKGPIGRDQLLLYALARTFRILDCARNRYRADCKGCGTELGPDAGRQVHIIGIGGRLTAVYFCCDCLQPVKAANERFPISPDLPAWWEDLDRAPDPERARRPRTREEILGKIKDYERNHGQKSEQSEPE